MFHKNIPRLFSKMQKMSHFEAVLCILNIWKSEENQSLKKTIRATGSVFGFFLGLDVSFYGGAF